MWLANLGHVAILFTREEKCPFLRNGSDGMHEEPPDGFQAALCFFKAFQKPCTACSNDFLICGRRWHCRGASAGIVAAVVDAISQFTSLPKCSGKSRRSPLFLFAAEKETKAFGRKKITRTVSSSITLTNAVKGYRE
jgi:hypothetical protein